MELIAQKREVFGKKAKNLKYNSQLAGVVYGHNVDSTPLTLDLNSFVKVFNEAGETSLVDLKLGDSNEKVLVKTVQYDPITLTPIHVEFYKVNLKEKITAQIPVEITGEETNELIKSGEALALLLMDEITVEAFPQDLPSDFIVDVSGLTEIGEGITVGQLNYDREKVEVVGLEDDDFVAKLDFAQMQEEVEEEVSEAEAIEGMEATAEVEEETEGQEGEGGEEAPAKKEE